MIVNYPTEQALIAHNVGFFLLPNRTAVTIRRYKARSGYHLFAAYRQPLFVCPNIFNCKKMNNNQNSSQPLQIFESPQFGRVRTAGTSEQPLFCLADVCKVLELQTGATKARLNEGGISLINTPTQSGEQQMVFINESNLYKVIMRSNKPQAEAFQDWVCGEVLPSIRKNGGYMAAREGETEQELLARAVLMAKATIDRQQQQLQEAQQHIAIAEETIEQNERQLQIANGTIEQQKKQIDTLTPDADYTREVLLSNSTFTFEQVSKDLQFPSVHKFIAELKNRAIIYKQSNTWMPTSKFSGRGYFGTRTHRYFHKDGSVGTELRTVITETGRQWLHSLNLRKAIA